MVCLTGVGPAPVVLFVGLYTVHATNNNAHQFQGEKDKDQGYKKDYRWDRKCIISVECEGLRTQQELSYRKQIARQLHKH